MTAGFAIQTAVDQRPAVTLVQQIGIDVVECKWQRQAQQDDAFFDDNWLRNMDFRLQIPNGQLLIDLGRLPGRVLPLAIQNIDTCELSVT